MPHFKPTDEQREQTCIAAAAGLPVEAIMRLVLPRTSSATLAGFQRGLRVELKHGRDQVVAGVFGALYEAATGDGRNAVQAQIFILRAIGGLRPTGVVALADSTADEPDERDDSDVVVDWSRVGRPS
jgi:hypothetical protein